jgi:tryptophanyl-tRNA synthetase
MDGCVQCNSNPFQFLAYQAATAPWAGGGVVPVGITQKPHQPLVL